MALALSGVAPSAWAGQDDQGRSTSARARDAEKDLREEVEELGMTLRAAVLSGTLTAEQAREIYRVEVARIKAEWTASRGDGAGGEAKEDADEIEQASVKRSVMQLSAPKPGHVSALFQPEFRRRDLQVLRQELDLDESQRIVIETLIGDYLEAFDLASSPLREALGRYQRTTRDQWLATALERSDRNLEVALQRAERVDPEVTAERIQGSLERIEREKQLGDAGDQDRARFESWARRMIEASGQLRERLGSIRARVRDELAEMGREDATITGDDLARLAKRLRTEREHLRAEMTTLLELIATEAQRGDDGARLTAVTARIRIDHLLHQGRLGGERMNLWAALAETGRNREPPVEVDARLAPARAMLRDQSSWIAELLDRRLEATLDREIEGLEFLTARERIAAADGDAVFEVEQSRLASAARPFADAARRELTAAVAVRDALVALLDASAARVDPADPESDLSVAYREAALERGFPTEMRRRWSERALAAAFKLDDLDDDTREALLALDASNRRELGALRADAIAKRLARDPELAREFLDAVLDGGDQDVEWKPEMWLGVNYEAFASVDDRTEQQLRGVLTTEQAGLLPRLRRDETSGQKDRK